MITPWDIAARVETMCRALPEMTMQAEGWARLFNIRRRTFCLLTAQEKPDGSLVPKLVLRAHPDEREVLLTIGHPFLASRAGPDRIEVLLNDDTDWQEIRELVNDSYRILAPKNLNALVEPREVNVDDESLERPYLGGVVVEAHCQLHFVPRSGEHLLEPRLRVTIQVLPV